MVVRVKVEGGLTWVSSSRDCLAAGQRGRVSRIHWITRGEDVLPIFTCGLDQFWVSKGELVKVVDFNHSSSWSDRCEGETRGVYMKSDVESGGLPFMDRTITLIRGFGYPTQTASHRQL